MNGGVWTTLANVGKWGSGGTPSSSKSSYYGGDIPWIRSGDLPDGPIADHAVTITQEGLDSCSAKWVPQGALLIALYGATIGKLGVATYPVTTNQAVAYCLPYKDIARSEYLFWYLLGLRPDLIALGQGGAQPNISQTILKAQRVLLPPLQEQDRIVGKLDSLFARTKRAREELMRVPTLVDRYRNAIISAAFSGALTARWRVEQHLNECEGPTPASLRQSLARLSIRTGTKPWKPRTDVQQSLNIPTEWCIARVADVAVHRSGVAYKSERFGRLGVQVVRLGNLYQGRLDLSRSPVFIANSSHDEGTFSARTGDILVSQTGTRYKRDYGHCVLLTPGDPEVLVNQRILCVSPSEHVLPEFLAYYGSTVTFREFFFGQETGGVNQGNVGVAGVMDAPCPVPSLAEQKQIVRYLDKTLDVVDRSLTEVRRA